MEKTFEVEGMTCVICKASVEKALSNINGVNSALVNLLENEVTVNFDDRVVDELTLSKHVNDAGYKLIIDKKKTVNKDKELLFISMILMIILMIVSYIYLYSKL